MMMPKPVASADPNGNIRVARKHRWIPALKLEEISSIETKHRKRVARVVSERGIYLGDFRPVASKLSISPRRAIINEFGDLHRVHDCFEGYGSYGDYKRSAESRGHSRSKKRWRRNRQRDIFF